MKKAGPPENWPERFLAAYAKNGNVSQSAKTAGVTREGVYQRRNVDAPFAVAMDAAREEACDGLEQEAHRRAVTGVLEPVFHQGEEIAKVRKYSDTLLIVLLKANRPKKFRENINLSGSVESRPLAKLTPEQLAAMEEILSDGANGERETDLDSDADGS